jgi:hypothetical protein
MGWMWRKTFWLGGPFRATLSNRGWGWSIGLPFLRYGVGPSGTPYVSFRIPRTGLYFTKFLRRSLPYRKPSNATASPAGTTTHSAPTSQLSANQKIIEGLRNQSTP